MGRAAPGRRGRRDPRSTAGVGARPQGLGFLQASTGNLGGITDDVDCDAGEGFAYLVAAAGIGAGESIRESLDMLKANFHEAESPDVKPVWQDTPSQTVDGAEEVTQKHNAQAQLDKYAEEHGTIIAQHQQKFRRYSRRKASKVGNVQAAAAAHPDDLPDEPCAAKRKAPWNSPQESPAAVTQRVSPAGATPRRSLRVAATSYATTTSHHSPSPGEMRLVKWRHTLDETYVPDADSDVAVEDAGAASQHVDDKLITNKRQRVAAVPSASGGKNPGNKKKARALERQHGQKNKAEAADAPTDRFQQTVRCSLGEVREAVKLLQECHRVKVREAGFGCVFDWVLEGNVSRVLMCHLMTKIDTSTMKIQCGSGKILDVNREAVHHVFGFPIGGDTAPRPSDSGHGASLAKLKEELGFERTGSIETKDLRSLLAKLVKDGTKIDLAVKVFFSILYNKLICPGSTVRLGREAAMLVDMNYKKMATMDFCQLVVDDLKRAAEKYQNSDVYQAGLEGCGVILVVMYLDSCYSVNHSVMHRRTPRASFLHQKPLRDIYNLDQIRSGGSDLSAYIFGKLAWKGRNDIVYSYRLPVEELWTGCSVPSSARSSEHVDSDREPLTRSQPEFLVTQAPILDSGSTPPSTLKSGGSRPISVMNKIVQLLQKVEDLSRSAPSIDDRLSRISGLFPPGHGPSTEAVKQVADHEASVLDSFTTAVSYLRKGFVDLGMKQDAICREYEREAVSIERQMKKQHADKAKAVVVTGDDDDDDFVPRAACKFTSKDVSKDVPVSLPSVSYVTRSGLVRGGIHRDKSTPGRNDSPSSKKSRKMKSKMIT
ncbi:uncharacterized protein [Lolium perenne]|uniref:uncharacterized protein n=1 Tax=Lolium perenne TaxID=4522 RepID=UPI0021F5569B|nr:uncharacterized protein LOC127292484 [Lolium perenne]